MSEFSGDQVHPASPFRREQAARDGDVAKSFELSGAVHALAAIGAAFLLVGGIANWIRNWTIQTWTSAGEAALLDSGAAARQLQEAVFSVSLVLAPILSAMFVAGILAHWGQSGIVFRAQRVAPDLARVGPRKWWQHVFSMNAISLPFVGLPKTLVAAATAGVSIWSQQESFYALFGLPVEQIGPQMLSLVLGVCFHVALVLFALSLADYGLQRWSFEKRIRMTDQQLRDETRMQQGDPQIVNQRRTMHRSLVDNVRDRFD